jgi:hypothetical protein
MRPISEVIQPIVDRATARQAVEPETLEAVIARVPEGCGWLVRSDGLRGYFANVFSQSSWDTSGREGTSTKAYASTPVAALLSCLPPTH